MPKTRRRYRSPNPPCSGSNFRGRSPATIINAQIDQLRDDGKLYAEKLEAAGVRVKRTLYSGVTHEFFCMGGAVAKAKLAMAEGCEELGASFGKAT
jgi:acetyl esterase